ncbi:ribosomal protein S18-alanine N-acetyltransferase [Aeromicrobium sp. CF4.19]|uniref:ribosomal protein S18-alanine N-acetyltransferase n=1 Tax=Aeromicrobium sp. CF4.19 TaxID=3373082 RepID=UPI003EE515EF
MTTRTAAPVDAAALAEVDAAAFGTHAWSAAAVESELAAHGRIVLVADGTPLKGWASVAVSGDAADLTRLGVRPQARNAEVARSLLEDVAVRAREAGARRILLEVAEDNHPALRLYEDTGFVRIATRRRYYPGGVDALVMERAL